MATFKLAVILLVVAIVTAKKRMSRSEEVSSDELDSLNVAIQDLIQEIEDLGCMPTGWEAPVDESLEDQIEAAEERVEELKEELTECMMMDEEEEALEEEEEEEED